VEGRGSLLGYEAKIYAIPAASGYYSVTFSYSAQAGAQWQHNVDSVNDDLIEWWTPLF